MFGIKSVVVAIAAVALIGSSAFAADGAMAPGKPAGVRQANEISDGALIIGGAAAAIIVGVAIAVGNNSGDRTPEATSFTTPSTSSTAP